jgi:hypothetical protein
MKLHVLVIAKFENALFVIATHNFITAYVLLVTVGLLISLSSLQ